MKEILIGQARMKREIVMLTAQVCRNMYHTTMTNFIAT
jgi:hypothetical protein